MICFVGNNDCYENHLQEYEYISKRTGVNILAINYRGVGDSKDKVTIGNHLIGDDIIADGMAAAKHLLGQNIPPENIMAYGHSQGGAVAAQVSALCPGIHVCIDRSFTNYIDATIGMLGRIIGNIAAAIFPSWWKFDSMKALKTMKGHKVILDHEKDAIIGPMARIGKRANEVFKEYRETEKPVFYKSYA